MIFKPLKISGVYLIEPEHHADERGTFARTWCRREFEQRGLSADLVQCNASYNHTRGTLRGMHYQCSPHQEAKLVRVTRGAIYDVVLDLRPNSRTYCQWVGVGLTAESHKMLYIPEGVAHGFQTLRDGSEVFYQMSEFYHPESARGVRWNDPAFNIEWPESKPIVAEKDQSWPDFKDHHSGKAA